MSRAQKYFWRRATHPGKGSGLVLVLLEVGARRLDTVESSLCM